MNIFLRGPVQIGKSTVIDKAVTLLRTARPLSVGGFLSFHAPDASGLGIAPAKIPRGDGSFVLFAENRGGRYQPVPGVFDEYAAELIKNSRSSDLVILDELGFFESDSFLFQDAVAEALTAAPPVLGVLKNQNIEWYRRILQEDILLFDVTEENRGRLPLAVADALAPALGIPR